MLHVGVPRVRKHGFGFVREPAAFSERDGLWLWCGGYGGGNGKEEYN